MTHPAIKNLARAIVEVSVLPTDEATRQFTAHVDDTYDTAQFADALARTKIPMHKWWSN